MSKISELTKDMDIINYQESCLADQRLILTLSRFCGCIIAALIMYS